VNLKTKELRAEKELVEVQNKVIEKKNQNITASIRYAKRIQDSILPMKEKISEVVGTGTVDGMDIALCSIDSKNKKLEFASSGRPLVLVNKTGLRNFSARKHPVGLITNKEVKFEKKTIYLGDKDAFYIFTDGYCDQFGGPDDDKFLEEQFEQVLKSINEMPMNEQAKHLEKKMDEWKGNNPQLDDILVIGVRC